MKKYIIASGIRSTENVWAVSVTESREKGNDSRANAVYRRIGKQAGNPSIQFEKAIPR
jgi:hypothetical protein